MVAHNCHSNYVAGIGGKIMDLGKNTRPYLKNN
jgi:hypothetical protein